MEVNLGACVVEAAEAVGGDSGKDSGESDCE